jgi:hypothetical protein
LICAIDKIGNTISPAKRIIPNNFFIFYPPFGFDSGVRIKPTTPVLHSFPSIGRYILQEDFIPPQGNQNYDFLSR